jgi:hypothetical protein
MAAMTPLAYTRRLAAVLLATLALLAGADTAHAGWFGLRNDTPAVLVVQESCVCNGVVRRCKPRVLYPGELALDGQTGPSRRLAVFDPRRPNQPLYQGPVPEGPGDVFLSIQYDLPPGVPPPDVGTRVRLVPTPPPARGPATGSAARR